MPITPPNIVAIYDSKDRESLFRYIFKNIRELYRFRYAIRNFVYDTLRTRYRRSVLGFLWSLLNPLMFMIILAVVFSNVFKQEIKTYAIFIFSGLVPWLFISSCVNGGTMALINAEGFLKKVYIPKLLFPVVVVTVETVNFFFSIVSLYLIGLVVGFPVSITFLLLPLVILISYIFTLGLVLIISVATIYFRDMTHITAILMQVLFYLVPIIYPLETMPVETQNLLVLNPFYYFILLFRKVIYGQPALSLQDWLIPLGLSLLSILIGMWVLKHNDRDIIYHL
jgi:ABC-type polysaccharide/polyol phosphate export permease